jgi:hypothetical protein
MSVLSRLFDGNCLFQALACACDAAHGLREIGLIDRGS